MTALLPSTYTPFEQQSDEEKRASYTAALLERNDARHTIQKIDDALHSANLDLQRVEDERDALQRKLDAALKPRDEALPTPEEITRRILDGSLDPAQARTALYALQVSLTAKRTEHLIAAQRQKEERLRSRKQSSPKPPRRTAKKPARRKRT